MAASLVAAIAVAGAAPGVDAIDMPTAAVPPMPSSPGLTNTDEVAWAYTYEISSPAGEENFHVLFDVGVAPDGGSVVVGQYFGTVVIGSGASQVTLTGAGPATSQESSLGFIAAFDPDNQLVWAQEAGAAGVEVEIAADGTIAMVGNLSGTRTFGTGAAARSLTASGAYDGFLARYAADGTLGWAVRAGGPTGALTWVRQAGGETDARPEGSQPCGPGSTVDEHWPTDLGGAVAVSPDGETIVIGGEIVGPVSFGSGAGVIELPGDVDDDRDVFVARFDTAGNVVWAQRGAGPGDLLGGRGIAGTSEGGAVYTGYFTGSATFGSVALSGQAGSTDSTTFVVRYGPDGSVSWATAGGPDSVGWGVDLSPAENAIVVGQGPGPVELGTASLRLASAPTAFRAQYGTAPGFEAIPPTRLVDTRSRPTSVDGQTLEIGPVPAGSVIRVPVSGVGPIPDDVDAVTLNLTVVEAAEAGYASVYPCGTAPPTSSNLNYPAGGTVPVAAVTAVGDDGAVCVFADRSANYLLDVTAFLAAGFGPITPERVLDQRPAEASRGDVVRVSLADVVPADATAVALMLTGVETTTAGFATVDDCSPSPGDPTTSNLNLAIGETRSNSVITSMSSEREVCISADAEASYLLDVAGWFTAGFQPVVPERLLDTTSEPSIVDGPTLEVGPVPAGSVIEVPVAGRAGVLNYGVGGAVPNGAYTGLSDNGSVCIFTDQAGQYLLDVTGWFIQG